MYTLTSPQQNIWNLQKYYEGTTISAICGAIYFKNEIDADILKRAINHVIEHQSGLRLRFYEVDGQAMQDVSEYQYEEIPVLQFSDKDTLRQYVLQRAQKLAGLMDIPLYHFAIFRLNGQTGIIAVLSHLISDAWTIGLLAKQAFDAYVALSQNVACDSKTWNYLEHIQAEEEYLTSNRYEKDTAYWQEKYPDKPEPTTIKLCTAATTSITAKRITGTLGCELSEHIGQFCEETGITPAVLFETAVILYLAKINPENRTVTIGIPVLGRHNAREKNTAGMFISTMPLTIPVSTSDTVEALANRITDSHRELFRHQRYPYSSILRQLREKHDFSGNLYDVMVSYQNAQTGVDAETEWFSNGYSETPFVFHIDNRDSGSSYTWTVDYQTEVFRREAEVQLIVHRLEHILRQILIDQSTPVEKISIIPDAEYQRMIFDFNDTAAEYPKDKCIHTLFEEQVERTPDKTAVIACDRTLTYRELNEESNRIAHSLMEQGVEVGDIVAFALPRNSHLIPIMFGILKAGAAYLPIDPDYPQARVDYMLRDSGARMYVTEQILPELSENENISNPTLVFSSENLCYCIYTSGSTGQPKGTLLIHRGIVNLVTNLGIYRDFSKCEHLGFTTTITFDVATQEILTALLNGFTGILLSERRETSFNEIAKIIETCKVDVIYATPTYFDFLTAEKCRAQSLFSSLKVICLAGEKFSLNSTTFKFGNQSHVIFENHYGPAETHVVTSKTISENNDITIGRPIANTQVYILDNNLKLLPIGVAGELCISGDGVGKGYLNRPELTAEKFVPNPFIPGKIMYRTGDLARWRADGEIEFLGRIDTQVKIRGLRIELGEIESVMAQFPGIGIAVANDQRDTSGRQYLVGYYTSETAIDEPALWQHLSAKLPKYMVPNYFVHLEKLPMTTSGKIDRKNLPLPQFTAQTTEYVPPETETEKQLSVIWSELLHIERVGRTDDFFELGGDSLMAISVLSKIKSTFQTELSIRDVMENSALERLADVINRADHTGAAIMPGHRGRYILLPQQKAIYAACQKNPQSLAYNMPVKVPLSDRVDRDKLIGCLEEVVNRHDSLKTRIISEGSEIYGVYDENARLTVENYANEDYSAFLRPFALETAPLVRVGFIEDSLLFDMHHIIADGDSLNIILREIVALYAGGDAPISDVAYADYADYFQRMDFSTHREYFKNMLRCDFEPVELPRRRDGGGTGGASLLFHLPAGVVDQGREFARANGLTDTMLFLGVYGIILSKYTGRADILSSVVLSNRTHTETSGIVGMFVNTLPVYLPVGGTIKEYFGKIKDLVLNLFQYQELPFLKIADAVGMTDKTVVNTSFVYQADGEKRLELDGETFAPEWLDMKSAKFDLLFEVTPVHDGCTVRIEYDCTKYDEVLATKLFAAYEKVLAQLTEENVSDISVLSIEEYRKIVYGFNDTAVDYPKVKCVHELIVEQAAKTPDEVALTFKSKQFTYRQLDAMSSALAVFLIDKGIGHNDIVPIIAQRSWHTIVAIIGVLKTGAGYMPIAPDYPRDRVQFMIMEATSRIGLVLNYNEQLEGIELLKLDELLLEESTAAPAFSVDNKANVTDTCYVIFTSGSTGTPKGVMVSHLNLYNYLMSAIELYKIGRFNMSLITNMYVDLSVSTIFLPLITGGTLEVIDENLIDGLKHIVSGKSTAYKLTPTHIDIMCNMNLPVQPGSTFIVGGEALKRDNIKYICENARLLDEYGPTETTVGCCFKMYEKDQANCDISIGKPIHNTQIYILDAFQNIVPIGVPGELCIAGTGVGLGYLNRPDLTSEKFVPNPFASDENKHGKILYHSGDLAAWKENGEIEYLGRIDTQVKIHGRRIELGEIESVMDQFPGISLTAVADRKDKTGRQYLVGYYTADAPLDESALRQHLSEKLPKYMVPNYFLHLEKLPMTPSGKIDRKNLPVPNFAAYAEEYVPPRNDQERTLCKIIGETLHYEPVGIRDNFFELGGDSLKAIEFVTKAHGEGIYFALQNVFDYPTVEALCGYLQDRPGNGVVFSPEQFTKYAPILERNIWDATFTPEQHTLGTVLLTGGTGFLGAHILDALMKHGVQKIYCLVRGSKERLVQRLQYYFGEQYADNIGKMIVPIVGDLESDIIGNDLPEQVDYIIHAAASVKHYGSWQYFKQENVDATQHVVSYALKVKAKLIYISTTSVSGNSMADQFDGYISEEEKHFYESSLYIGQPLDNVYARSKFEAETLVLDAMCEGLRANILRMGNLTNRVSGLKFQPNYEENAFLKRVKAVLDLGCLPEYLTAIYAEFTPVDSAAEAIVRIAEHMNDRYTVFHVNSNQNLYFDRMLEYLERAGRPLEVLSGREFAAHIRATISSSQKYIFEALSNELNQDDFLQYDSNIRIENSFTVQYLRSIGFEWPEIDYVYIKGYLRYFEQLGYIGRAVHDTK